MTHLFALLVVWLLSLFGNVLGPQAPQELRTPADVMVSFLAKKRAWEAEIRIPNIVDDSGDEIVTIRADRSSSRIELQFDLLSPECSCRRKRGTIRDLMGSGRIDDVEIDEDGWDGLDNSDLLYKVIAAFILETQLRTR